MTIWMCDYPSKLNVSAIEFERCGGGADAEEATPTTTRLNRVGRPWNSVACVKPIEADGHFRQRSRMECEDGCKSLADDIILSRLSSLLSVGAEASAFMLIPGNTSVILPALIPTPSDATPLCDSIATASFLRSVGIKEVESLDPSNGGAGAGQCQFACLALALSKSMGAGTTLRDGHRPDLELRKLALHVIQNNTHLYQDFLTVARGRTRAQNQEGGSSVDMNEYIRRMSDPTCDGDAVTLQALCDALKITVRVVKSVDARAYDEESQRKRILTVSSDASISGDERSVVSDDSSNTESDEIPTTSFETCSNIYWPSNNPYALTSLVSGTEINSQTTCSLRKRLCVSQEIRPRPLDFIDSRIRDIQDKICGRLIWLSHIGSEAHYRFLRPIAVEDKSLDDPFRCLCGAVNEQEAYIARHSRMPRMVVLRTSCFEDGYMHRTVPKSGSISALNAAKKQWAGNVDISPRCGLCFEGTFQSGSVKTIISPSCCHHEFCRKCLEPWASNVSFTCPTCRSHFSALVSSATGKSLDNIRELPVRVASQVYSLRPRRRRITRINSTSSISSSDDELLLGPEAFKPMSPPFLPKECEDNVEDSSSERKSPLFLARKALLEISEDHLPVTFLKKCRGAGDEDSLLELIQRLAALVTDSALPDLLAAGILRAIRLTLTPSFTATGYISTAVDGNGESDLYVPGARIFMGCVLLLDFISERCWCEKKWLTLDMLKNSLDLPKLLLWYLSCRTLPTEFLDANDGVSRTLERWSSQFGLSTTAALQGMNLVVTDAKSPTHRGEKSSPFKVTTKRKVISTTATVAKSKKPRVEDKPVNTIRRAVGKRKIKPVLLSNITREQWGLVRY